MSSFYLSQFNFSIFAISRGHLLSVETTLGNVHCSSCGDFVYDPELDQVAEKCLRKSSKSLGMGNVPPLAWRPSPDEVSIVAI